MNHSETVSLFIKGRFIFFHVVFIISAFLVPMESSALLLGVFLYFTRMFGVTAGYHRYFSHRAFKTSRSFAFLLACLAQSSGQRGVIWWASNHRHHHRFSDMPQDLHSPVTGTLFHAHVGWLFAKEQAGWGKFAPDLIRSRDIMAINSSYLFWVLLGLALPAAIGGAITQTWMGAFNGLIWGGLFRIFLLDHVTWTVNSICHTVGSQPHKSDDNSRNIFLLCIPSVGGSFHNNHHAFPIGARNDHQSKLQLDLSGMFIELLGVLGLANNIKRYKKKS